LLEATTLEPLAEAVEEEVPLKTEAGVEAEFVVTDLSDIYISF